MLCPPLDQRCPLFRPLLGVKRTSPSALHMSAFDPKRTFVKCCKMSANDPKRTSSVFYSITSSAKEISPDGMASPSDLAVLRLITNSYLVG